MSARDRRPRLAIPWSSLDRILEALALVAVVAGFALAGSLWSQLPDRSPAHFGPGGSAGAWAGRNVVLVLPAIVFVVWGLLTLIELVPHTFNYPWPITPDNARVQYTLARRLVIVIKLFIAWLFVAILGQLSALARGGPQVVPRWLLVCALPLPVLAIAVYVLLAARSRHG